MSREFLFNTGSRSTVGKSTQFCFLSSNSIPFFYRSREALIGCLPVLLQLLLNTGQVTQVLILRSQLLGLLMKLLGQLYNSITQVGQGGRIKREERLSAEAVKKANLLNCLDLTPTQGDSSQCRHNPDSINSYYGSFLLWLQSIRQLLGPSLSH